MTQGCRPYLLTVTKAELLCYGLRIDGNALKELIRANPFVRERTLVHALHISINGCIINVCVSEKFCSLSPYVLIHDEGFRLLKNGAEICEVDVIEIPDWCKTIIDGYITGKYLRPHSLNCISCSPILLCGYTVNGKGCKFCSLSEFSNKKDYIIPEKSLAKMIYCAMMAKDYELNFSAGTLLTNYKSEDYYLSVLRELRNLKPKYFPKVSIEMTPPDDEQVLYELADNGVKALIFNIEIASSELRKAICPGKGEISLEHYLSMIDKAVNILGRGNVSSVLLAGIQPADDIIKMGSELILLGAIPTIMPFKPLDDCEMKKHNITDPKELLYISSALGEMMRKKGLSPKLQCGCTKCGGCSLEDLTSTECI